MNDDNFFDAMEDIREPPESIPDPSYAKGHSDGVSEEREAILAIVR